MTLRPLPDGTAKASFDFVGVFACRRGDADGEEVVRTTVRLAELATCQPWREIVYALRTGRTRHSTFSEGAFKSLLGRITDRTLLTLDLSASDPGHTEWWRSYTDFSSFESSFFFEPQKLPHERTSSFPPGCAFLLTFPSAWFAPQVETRFQANLLAGVARIFAEETLSYAFINLGMRDYEPRVIGIDTVFRNTLSSVPISAFDADLTGLRENIYEDHIRSAAWCSFLNTDHVRLLGSFDKLKEILTFRLSPVGDGGAIVQLTASPLDRSAAAAVAYQGFRDFIKPIRVETKEDKRQVLRSLRGQS